MKVSQAYRSNHMIDGSRSSTAFVGSEHLGQSSICPSVCHKHYYIIYTRGEINVSTRYMSSVGKLH